MPLDPALLAVVLFAMLLLAVAGAAVFIQRSQRENASLLQAQMDRTETLSDVLRSIAASPTEYDELVETLYVGAAQLLETEFLQLGIFEGNEYRTLIWVRDGSRQPNTSFQHDEDSQGMVGWIRENGEPILVQDFLEEMDRLPAQPSYQADDPPRSGVFVPIHVDHMIDGVLSVQSRSPHTFDKEDLHLLSILGDAVGTVLQKIRTEQLIELRTLQLLLLQETGRQLISLDPIPTRIAHILSLIAQAFNFEEVAFYDLEDGGLVLMTSSLENAPENPEQRNAVLDLVSRAAEFGQSVGLDTNHLADDPQKLDEPHQLAMPVKVKNRVLGVVYIHCAPDQVLTSEEVDLTEMLAAQLAIAKLEAHNYTQQQEEAWITTVLLEVAKHASQPGNTEQALQAVLRLTNILTGTNWAMILLPDAQDGSFRIGPNAGINRARSEQFADVHLPSDSIPFASTNEESEIPIEVDVPGPIAAIMDSRRALSLNLSDGQNVLGILLLEAQPMTSRRSSLIGSIGHQVSLRLENTRLIEEAANRRILERELATAKNIQSSFLPKEVPDETGWTFGVSWQSARQVGGDFYDFIPIMSGGRRLWTVVIADVADKGIPAALYMALCRTLIRSVAREMLDPAEMLKRVNQFLFTDTEANLFVSVFLGVLDPETGILTYANAGHNPPVFATVDDDPVTLDRHGIVLGVLQDATFESYSVELERGSLLVLYTDGVTEACAETGDLYGMARLKTTIAEMDFFHSDPAKCIEEEIIRFCGLQDLYDDMTIITIMRDPTKDEL